MKRNVIIGILSILLVVFAVLYFQSSSTPTKSSKQAYSPTTKSGPQVTIRVQSVLPTKADEIVMVKDFAANVAALTNGEVKIEVLPDGAIVSGRDILDAVDKGLVEAGFA